MKKLSLISFLFLIYLSSCTTGQYTASREYDDVYYSSSDKNYDNQATQNPASGSNQESSGNNSGSNQQRFDYNGNTGENNNQPEYTSTEERNGNTYITNNYYNENDYYDYSYSSRIKRFYHPYGWSYYDSYYTNSYWYDYNPYSWGVSIYLGYNFWHPYHVGPSWGFHAGYGYPSYGFGNPWYNPWYSPYYGSYGHGYHNGYIDGYYAGLYNGTFNPYYYNSHDNYSYYYGPRGKGSALNTTGTIRPVSELYASSTNTIDRDKGNSVKGATAAAPFQNPKHYTLQPEIRDVKTGKQNDIKTVSPGVDPRNSKGVVNDGKSNVPVKGNTNTPVKGNDIRNNAPDQPVKNDGKNYTAPDRSPVTNPKSNAPVDIRNYEYDNNSDAPVRNYDGKNVTPRNDAPVRNNDGKNVTPREVEPKRSPGNIKTGAPGNPDMRTPRIEKKNQNRQPDRPAQQVTPDKNPSQAPVYSAPQRQEPRSNNSGGNRSTR